MYLAVMEPGKSLHGLSESGTLLVKFSLNPNTVLTLFNIILPFLCKSYTC